MSERLLIITLAPAILVLIVAFLVTVIVAIFLRSKVVADIFNRGFKGDQVDIRELEQAKRRARVFNFINMLVALVSVLAAALTAYLYFAERNKPARLGNWRNIFDPMPFAYAQTSPQGPAAGQAAVTTPVQPFLGYMLSAILIVMLVVFLFAVIAVLVLRDVPENVSRRTAANDIVKTFGGFFIGVLTSFLKQALGG